jgi:hypothetical protein
MPDAHVNPLPAIAVLNGFQIVPIADSPDNVVMRDVVGNKTDTVAGNSVVSLVKIVDANQDVPGLNSADNLLMRDVVGNKTDTVAGNSVISLLKQMEGTGFATGVDSLKVLSDILDLIRTELTFQHQADATLSQALPSQWAWYTILNTTLNARIISVQMMVADTAEDLQLKVTIDGNVIQVFQAAAVAGTSYVLTLGYGGFFVLSSATDYTVYKAFLFEARSVKVEVQKLTANGTGTLSGTVIYAKR